MKTADISGMGGGYKHACQMMVRAGLEFFKEHGLPDAEEWKEEKSDRMKKLEECLIKAADNDCTGAMFYSARAHAYQRASKGDEWYFAQFKDEPTRVYEWDGTPNTVPQTDLSREMEAKTVKA